MDVSAHNTTNESKIDDSHTFSKIKVNNTEYGPEFESDGIKIPSIFPSVLQRGPYTKMTNKPYYLKIPKDVLLDMLREYLPELKEEIKAIVFSDLKHTEKTPSTDRRKIGDDPLFYSDL